MRQIDSTTVRQFDSTTVRQFDSTTVRQFDSTTVRQFDSTTVRQFDSTTVRQFDSTTVRQFDSTTVRQYYNPTYTVVPLKRTKLEEPAKFNCFKKFMCLINSSFIRLSDCVCNSVLQIDPSQSVFSSDVNVVPEQSCPLPVNPSLQAQVKLPMVLVQFASAWQSSVLLAHSSISIQE